MSDPNQLEERFLGRVDEQARFRQVLQQVLETPSAEANDMPYIFLLYGLGGMGKTRLGHRFIEIAEGEAPFSGKFQTLRLDWEAQRTRATDSRYSLAVHDQVDFEALFYHLYASCRDAGFGKEFDPYERAQQQRQAVESKVVKLVRGTGIDPQNRYAIIGKLGANLLGKLVRAGTPVGPFLLEAETGLALEAVVEGGAKGMAQVRELAAAWLDEQLSPEERDLFINPHEKLALALGQSLRAVARKTPLVFVLDTYEIVDRADPFLRPVIKQAGRQIIWVISGRPNLADSRRLGRKTRLGYLGEFGAERVRAIAMSEFSLNEIAAYLLLAAPRRRRELTPETARAVHEATAGIPLAVKTAAAIWAAGKPLAAITGDKPADPDRKKLVKTMTDRFFVHCLAPEDEQALYALALAHQPGVGLLSAMLASDDLTATLGALAGRYAFVLAAERQLHAIVREYTLERLLNQGEYELPQIRELNQRAVVYLAAEQAELAERAPTLEACLEDERWTAATLGLVYHTFWLAEDAGWDTLLPAFSAALYYDRAFGRTLLAEIGPLVIPLIQRQKRYKKLGDYLSDAADLDKFFPGRDHYRPEGELLAELAKTTEHWPVDKHQAERKLILDLLQGRHQYNLENYEAAFHIWKAQVEAIQQRYAHLQGRLADDLYNLSGKLMWPDAAQDALYSPMAQEALQMAAILTPTVAKIHYYLGASYAKGGKFAEAEQAYRRAIALDAKYAYPHHGLGNLYRTQGKFTEAEQAYRRAIALDAKLAAPHHGLGNLYRTQGKFAEAEQAYRRAIALDAKYAYPHNGLGSVYMMKQKYDLALKHFSQAVALAPEKASYQASLAAVQRRLGNEAAFREHLARARSLIEKETPYNKACLEAIAGNQTEALAYLAQALKIEPGLKNWAAQDPDFETLRQAPAFWDLVKGKS